MDWISKQYTATAREQTITQSTQKKGMLIMMMAVAMKLHK
jgi:hypothetical protein